jgi:hypothetical protein
VHQLFEQFNEQLTRQPALVGGKPECAFGIDGRRSADALPRSESVTSATFLPLPVVLHHPVCAPS